MTDNKKNKENGSVEVEATIILPIAILCVALLLYVSLLLFQRANLQAALETALVYYKNTVTDTFVTQNDKVNYGTADAGTVGKGNSYSAVEPLNPYTGIFTRGDLYSQDNFETYFKSITGKMIFNEGIQVDMDYTNYFLLSQFEVTATQKITLPIDFSVIGVGDEYEISAAARVAVVDHDDTIRNVDYAIQLINRTKMKDYIDKYASKISDAYTKLKDILGAK